MTIPYMRAAVNYVRRTWSGKIFTHAAGTYVILVLQGHLHVSELLAWRGTTFIVGGAICG